MRVLTVRNPWAWAIFHADPVKDVENRSQAWGYRGEVAIHAGLVEATEALLNPVLAAAVDANRNANIWQRGILGTVQLVDVHVQTTGCCTSRWAQHPHDDRPVTHLVLERPIAFRDPIPARGALGLWKPDADLRDAIDQVRRSGAVR